MKAIMPPSVLVVDDRSVERDSIARALEGLDARLVLATSGEEALRYVLGQDFAVILLDVSMPDMDGFETARFIRERPRSRLTPIIFLTAIYGSERDIDVAYTAGAVDYIMKPFDAAHLRSKVGVFVDLYRKAAMIEQHAADLEAANKELETFSYSVSHDLRAPLRAINGFARAFLLDHKDQLDEAGKKQIETVIDKSVVMAQLIDDLLMLASASRQALSVRTLPLGDLIRAEFDELKQECPERKIKLQMGNLPDATGDRSLIKIVLHNLLGNAVKFTRPNKTAEITVSGSSDDSETIFCIRDNGVGFDMEYADHLFQPFQRLHTASEFEGTGIGLALVQRIILRHGGRVWIESEPQKGTAVYFTLAKAASVQAAGKAAVLSLQQPGAKS